MSVLPGLSRFLQIVFTWKARCQTSIRITSERCQENMQYESSNQLKVSFKIAVTCQKASKNIKNHELMTQWAVFFTAPSWGRPKCLQLRIALHPRALHRWTRDSVLFKVEFLICGPNGSEMIRGFESSFGKKFSSPWSTRFCCLGHGLRTGLLAYGRAWLLSCGVAFAWK